MKLYSTYGWFTKTKPIVTVDCGPHFSGPPVLRLEDLPPAVVEEIKRKMIKRITEEMERAAMKCCSGMSTGDYIPMWGCQW